MLNKNRTISKVLFPIFCSLALAIACFGLTACAPSEYKNELKSPELKTPDILENGKLKVGVDYGNPPLAGETSKSAGIDIDVASAIGDELGLEVEFVDIRTTPELAIQNKKVDIVMGLSKSTNVADMWRSESYIQTACAIFSKDQNAPMPTRESPQKISTQMGSASALAAQAQMGADSVKFENNISKCLDSLDKGEVKYVAGDAVITTYNAKTSEINASIIALLTKPSGYCIGVSKDNTVLSDKIKGALENLNMGGILSVIEKKWLGKSLNLDKVQQTPEASNQADAGEIDAGVYLQTDPNAPKDPTNI